MTSVRYLSLQILPSWYTRRIRSLHVFVFLAFALPHKQGGGNQVTFR